MPYTPEESSYLKQIGERIRQFRLQAGLSQEDLAYDSELDRTYIGSVERGERNIAVINLRKIATALKINPSELLDLES